LKWPRYKTLVRRFPGRRPAELTVEPKMALPAQSEHRNEHRRRVLKGAAILTGVSRSEIRCEIRNMHEHGAELKLPSGTVCPPEFLLYVPADGIGYRSIVRWRAGERVGVAFTGTEPKPHWHYG
jgi:hypothetical protein